MKTSIFKLLLALLTLVPLHGLLGQKTVDFTLIKQKKIKKIIRKEHLQSVEDFTQVKSRCLCEEDTEINEHKKSYIVQFPLDVVWDAYLTTPPKNAWSAKLVSLGMLFQGDRSSFYYRNQLMPAAEVGQLVFINLHLLNGFFNVAVAHKIMEINDEKHLIRTCYVESGASAGTQFIRFYALGDNQTRVEHTTLYKSKSKFRDKYLYPFLHEKVITEFHSNISHYLILAQKTTLRKHSKPMAKLNEL